MLVKITCETDFVSGNEQFKDFVTSVAEAALAAGAADADAVKALQINGAPFAEALAQAVQKLGENMQLGEISRIEGDVVTGYNHGGRVATDRRWR